MSQRLFGDDIRFQQRFLKTAGLYDGNIDGDWGPRTDAADQAFAAETARIADELGRFDSRTEANLHTLHLPVQRAARMFLHHVRDAAIDARIISGTRSYQRVDEIGSG
jgi:peptidoglycan L-alanyl-D-glutamate endopeptidase CwlK